MKETSSLQMLDKAWRTWQGRIIGAVSCLLFYFSLTQPALTAFDPANADQWVSGAPFFHIVGLASHDGNWAWCANPVLLVAWIFLLWGRWRWIPVLLATAATGLALSFLWVTDTVPYQQSGEWLFFGGFGSAEIQELGLGYWSWVLSMAIIPFLFFWMGLEAGFQRRRFPRPQVITQRKPLAGA